MKKTFVTISAIILCLCLSACAVISTPGTSDIPSESTSNTTSPDSSDDSSNATAPIYPLSYDSLSDLKSAISQGNEEELYAEFTEAGAKSEDFDKIIFFVEKLRSDNVTVPHLDGEVIEFRNNEGYSNISLFAVEAYGLPWIFYHPEVSTGENFYIKITYLPDTVENSENITASEVIKELSPGSPNINNLGERHKSIYNEKIKLGDREVLALVCEYKTDSRNSVMFVYDDLLVEVRCDPQVWNEQWFSALSFAGFEE